MPSLPMSSMQLPLVPPVRPSSWCHTYSNGKLLRPLVPWRIHWLPSRNAASNLLQMPGVFAVPPGTRLIFLCHALQPYTTPARAVV